MKYQIIAVDFDGTLCDNCYPNIGEAKDSLISWLKEQQAAGDKLILWTCRVGERLNEAIRWCSRQGLYFDAVNDNLPEITKEFGSNSRKIFAHKYIDDRNVYIREFNISYYE